MTAMKDLTLGIVGHGVVGSAMAHAFNGYVKQVLVSDVKPERANASLTDVMRADLIFVCLPTPQREGSLECNTDFLCSFFEGLTDEQRQANIVIRSTVPVGFTRATMEKMGCPSVVHSPEFLTARTAIQDANSPVRNVIGEPSMKRMSFCPPDMPVITSRPWTTCGTLLRNLYLERWPKVPLFMMSPDESEAVKLIQNSFSAAKIALFNEFRCFCDTKGLHWSTVLAAVLA